jgi:hypothetical protein
MTPLTHTSRPAPLCEPTLAPAGLRLEIREPAGRGQGQTTWLRPRYSLSAHGKGLGVKVEAAACPC